MARATLHLLAIALCAYSSHAAFQNYQMIDTGEVDLSVTFEGHGAKKAILLHGFPEASGVWEPVASLLSDEFTMAIPDLRGYNSSDQPEHLEDYHVDKIVADIFGLYKHFTDNGEKIYVIAHDWGGLVGWVFTHKHPEVVEAFAVMNCPNPTAFVDLITTNEDQASAASYLKLIVNHPWVTEKYLAFWGYRELKSNYNAIAPQDMIDDLVTVWEKSLTSSIRYYAANTHVPSDFSFKGMTLPTFPNPCDVQVPTLFLWGMKDPMYIPQNMEDVKQYVPEGLLTVKALENSEHFPNIDDPEGVVNAIKEWLPTVASVQ